MTVDKACFPDSILITKLASPVLPGKTIARERLMSHLDEGMSKKLTLIVAPAGFGKTTLVQTWVSDWTSSDHPLGWVSLDERDDSPRFWTYVLLALHRLHDSFSFNAKTITQNTLSAVDYTFLDELLNAIALIPRPFTLVLEDYHCISDPAIDASLSYLISHASTNLHLVIVSRTTPGIPMARLRSQEQLVEIEASELAFTKTETMDYLQNVMGISLDDDDLALFCKITDGWVAGMQIASLSIKNAHNTAKVLEGFSGEGSKLFAYFTEEVVEHLPWEIRDFLVHTSFLEWVTPQLCDAVMGIDDSKERLRYLEQAQLFLVPFDEKRIWYRYHPLFRDYLRSILLQGNPENLTEMYKSAYLWLSEHGYPDLAIPHALECEEYEGAISEMEKAYEKTDFFGSEAQAALQWIERIPTEVIEHHPQLALLSIRAHIGFGHQEALQNAITQYSEILMRLSDKDIEEAGGKSYRDEMLMVLAIAACARADYGQALELDKQVSEETKRGDEGALATIYGHFMHYAKRAYGDSDAALLLLRRALRHAELRGSNNGYVVVSCSLGQLLRDMGRLNEAMNTYLDAFEFLRYTDYDKTQIGFIEAGMSDIYRERYEIVLANDYAGLAEASLSDGIPDAFTWHCEPDFLLIIANNHFDNGRYEKVLSTLRVLRSTTDLYYKVPFLRSLSEGLLVRCWIMLGYTTRLDEWIGMTKKAVQEERRFASMPIRIELARALLSRGRTGEALEALPAMPEKDDIPTSFYRYWIEGFLIQARALSQTRERAKARASLLRAIELASRENFVHVFIEEGLVIKPLFASLREELMRAGTSRISKAQADFVEHLWSACLEAWENQPFAPHMASKRSFALLEALSTRESEVLKLIVAGLSVEQISRQLYISLHTTRTHFKSIYRKLDAHSRDEAIEHAVGAGLV